MTDTKSNDSEYGPWINHDGKGCPCIGQWVILDRKDMGISNPLIAGKEAEEHGVDVNGPGSAWFWSHYHKTPYKVMRYRLRKPKGMQILEALLENLPDAVKELSKENV